MCVREAIANRLSIRQYTEVLVFSGHMETLFAALQLAFLANNSRDISLPVIPIRVKRVNQK